MEFYGKSFAEKFESKMICNIEPMTLLAGAGILGGAGALTKGLSSYFGGQNAEEAARIQAASADKAMGQLGESYQEAKGFQEPFYGAGVEGLGALTSGLLGGEFRTDVPQFEYDEFDFERDPGAAFREEQGLQALQRSAGARGGALGGGAMKDIMEYSQGLASQEYGAAHDRYRGERAFDYGLMGDLYSRQNQQQMQQMGGLQGLAGIGQGAAGNLSNLATGYGGNLADLITGKGSVQAAGRMAQTNPWLEGITSGLNTASQLGGMYMMGGGAGGAPGTVGAPLPPPTSAGIPNFSGFA